MKYLLSTTLLACAITSATAMRGKESKVFRMKAPDTGEDFEVDYWVNAFGQAVSDDDIILGPENDILKGQHSTLHKRWFAVKPSLAWENGTLRWKYRDQQAKRSLDEGFQQALRDWTALAPYLTFIEEPVSSRLSSDIITITAIEGDGCHSNVGRDPQTYDSGIAMINLDPYSCFARSMRHEWGHQLGLLHEHMRPDREKFVHFDCDAFGEISDSCSYVEALMANCCPYEDMFASQIDDPCCWNIGQFSAKRFVGPAYQRSGTLDYDSVMLYRGINTNYAKPGMAVLVRVDTGEPTANNTEISQGDVDGVCEIYKELCDAYYSDNGPTASASSSSASQTSASVSDNSLVITRTTSIASATDDSSASGTDAGVVIVTASIPPSSSPTSQEGIASTKGCLCLLAVAAAAICVMFQA